jgi:thiamine-monophosphate kinase
MMDVSDGLLLDARRMAEASGCTAGIALAAIPLAPGVEDALAAASWGDDYELLFAAPADFVPPVAATRIGAFAAAGPHPLLLDGAAPRAKLGYEHR